MSERTINISFAVKETILLSLKENKEDFTKEVLFSSALLLYRKRKLSLGKAAELAGCSKIDFIQKMTAEQEHIFDYDHDEIVEIIKDADRIPTK